MLIRLCRLGVLAAFVSLLLPTGACAATPPPDHWVATWATASYAGPAMSPDAAGMTYREIVHTTLAGPLVRVELSNQFGTEPLLIGAAHLALADPGGGIQLASANALTFGGQPSIAIPPGAVAVSDPAALAVPAGADLAISLFLPAQTITHASIHGAALTTSYAAPGNVVGRKTLTSPTTITSWGFLKAVDVQVPAQSATIVAFGDSITDGAHSTLDGHDSWPAILARRFAGNKKTARLAVANEGIGGNRLLRDGVGPSALARFDSDVLALPGVRTVILLEGINDIGRAEDPAGGTHDVPADSLIQALAQLVARAHTQGIQAVIGTLTPYAGANYASPAGEQIRKAVNAWIRTQNQSDGFIDFDAATRDKASPDALNPAYDSGDHLHPSPAGYKAMADAIDLKLFELNKQEKYDITHQQ